MIDEPIQFGGAPHRLRGWLIFVLEEATRQGLAPVSQEKLHLLFFYAAVLAPVHGVEEPVPKILKFRDRPFYPEAQEELLRLAASGFASSEARRSIRDDGWESRFAITAAGVEVSSILKRSRWGRRTSGFVQDLVASFAELDPDHADQIIDQDATFRDGRMAVGDIRDLREENLAAATARHVADFEVDGVRPGARESIALYFDYLQARRAA
ncbi:hypothetical protein [Sphingomonas sp. PR090111-T3T-6A]|uniref:hypothetical protein n=1 Tax=Sphingomonas sp. PR090111-T3T-6A TaxID=685778 RepID=UPI00036A1CC1|nr:hypothetical protein [Sphingomonas sp. PR090111-T3T-6A]